MWTVLKKRISSCGQKIKCWNSEWNRYFHGVLWSLTKFYAFSIGILRIWWALRLYFNQQMRQPKRNKYILPLTVFPLKLITKHTNELWAYTVQHPYSLYIYCYHFFSIFNYFFFQTMKLFMLHGCNKQVICKEICLFVYYITWRWNANKLTNFKAKSHPF